VLAFDALPALYDEPGFQVPAQITSYVNGKPTSVTLW